MDIDHYAELADLAEQALCEDASPADRLGAAKELILEAIKASREAVRGTSEEDRAEAYWLAHIEDAVTGKGHSPSMTDAIAALRRESEGADEEA